MLHERIVDTLVSMALEEVDVCGLCSAKHMSPGRMDAGPLGQKVEPDEEVCPAGSPPDDLMGYGCVAEPILFKVAREYAPTIEEFLCEVRAALVGYTGIREEA